jgi:hypothetical protein
MITNDFNAFIFSAVTVLLLVAAIFSPHDERVTDLVFFGLSLIAGALTIYSFKKRRQVKTLGLY